MYTPLFVHSHYSVLRGLNTPKAIIKHVKKLGLKSCALTDINNMSGCIEFYKTAKEEGIKPILGSCVSTPDGTLVLIALNKSGYTELLQIVARTNSKSPQTMTLEELKEFNLEHIICISGHEGSILYNTLAKNYKEKEFWQNLSANALLNLRQIFYDDNCYIDIQWSEHDDFSKEIKKKLIDLSVKTGNNVKLVISPRVYYLNKEDQDLHKILISTDEGVSIDDLNQINHPMYKFIDGYRFYMPSYQEICEYNILQNPPLLENTNKIAERVEDYELQQTPAIPKFKTKFKSSEAAFVDAFKRGWDKKIKNVVPKDQHEEYFKRIAEEVNTFRSADLFDYFLIVSDIINYGKSKGYLIGSGRGSVGGCLTGYLLGIHEIDSIKYNLLFSRFYNAGRKGSLPDIDTDFPKRARADIINYIVKKYGKDNVMQIATYGTLMGRAALKAVFRAYKDISFAEQNEITKHIVDKAKISDELQDMKKLFDEGLGPEPSVIRWCLENKSGNLSSWCIINKERQLEGPLAKRFEQAIRLEGVISSLSKHAAGIVISPKPLKTMAPIVYDPKEKQQIIGVQMTDLEYIGLVKLDILGLSTLDRLEDINDI